MSFNGRQTLVSTHCADSDIERTYPAIQMGANASKETTYMELVAVENMDYTGIRTSGFELIGGSSNALIFCKKHMGMPTCDELLEEFINQ